MSELNDAKRGTQGLQTDRDRLRQQLQTTRGRLEQVQQECHLHRQSRLEALEQLERLQVREAPWWRHAARPGVSQVAVAVVVIVVVPV